MGEKEPHVVVIGAVNVDIKGRPHRTMVPRTSNPGTIEISPGGVGRNIAENLARLNIKTTLISALSTDVFSKMLIDETKQPGVSFEHALITDEYPSGLFCAILDHRGDLIHAITDMSILSTITPEFLKTKEEIIRSADYILLDADIPSKSIEYVLDIAQEEKIPTCIDRKSVV